MVNTKKLLNFLISKKKIPKSLALNNAFSKFCVIFQRPQLHISHLFHFFHVSSKFLTSMDHPTYNLQTGPENVFAATVF